MSRPDDDGDNGNAADDGEDGMRVQTASDEPSAEAAFKGEIASVNFIATCLRGLFNGKRDQRVEVTLTPGEGMHMTVTDSSKSIQGIASVGANVFDIFETKDDAEEVCFRVNLAILLDCLTMCSGPTRLRLCYNQNEETIALQLNEGDAITECNIRVRSFLLVALSMCVYGWLTFARAPFFLGRGEQKTVDHERRRRRFV